MGNEASAHLDIHRCNYELWSYGVMELWIVNTVGFLMLP
jgi:hypothetical protein